MMQRYHLMMLSFPAPGHNFTMGSCLLKYDANTIWIIGKLNDLFLEWIKKYSEQCVRFSYNFFRKTMPLKFIFELFLVNLKCKISYYFIFSSIFKEPYPPSVLNHLLWDYSPPIIGCFLVPLLYSTARLLQTRTWHPV